MLECNEVLDSRLINLEPEDQYENREIASKFSSNSEFSLEKSNYAKQNYDEYN